MKRRTSLKKEVCQGGSLTPLSAILLILLPLLIHPKSSEKVFTRAQRYTVRIYSSTVVALEGAERGSHEGSGFVVKIDRKEGKAWVATNKHVIDEGISSVQISFKDGERFPAEPVYIDPVYDFGMVSFNLDEAGVPEDIAEATLGNSSKIEVGHEVGTFGNPLSLEYCATEGIVSSITNTPWGFNGAFLQTDAAINPGNSGGPLISLETGRVIGINTAVRNHSEGIGWSLGIDQLEPIITEVLAGSLPYAGRMGWLGIELKEINLERAAESFGAEYEESPRKALLVVDVYHETPAARAGMESGDILYSLNGRVPKDFADFLLMMRSLADESSTITVSRLGELIELEAEIVDRGRLRPDEYVTFAGMTIQPTSPRVYENYSVSSTNCVFVSDVKEGSSAEAWGMYHGYSVRGVLVEMAYHPVYSLDDFWQAIKDVVPGQPVELFMGSSDYGWIVKVAYYYPAEAPWQGKVDE